jgi:hypothetical protein
MLALASNLAGACFAGEQALVVQDANLAHQ